jgi:hypothetical protein
MHQERRRVYLTGAPSYTTGGATRGQKSARTLRLVELKHRNFLHEVRKDVELKHRNFNSRVETQKLQLGRMHR